MKIHPFFRVAKMHQGIDFTVPVGTKVYATADGIIKNIGSSGKQGNVITIDHGNGYKTVYAHLDRVLVAKNEKVRRGKIIALSGDSGISIWAHLHYEVWKNDKNYNPVLFFFAELKPTEIKKIIEISTHTGQSLD